MRLLLIPFVLALAILGPLASGSDPKQSNPLKFKTSVELNTSPQDAHWLHSEPFRLTVPKGLWRLNVAFECRGCPESFKLDYYAREAGSVVTIEELDRPRIYLGPESINPKWHPVLEERPVLEREGLFVGHFDVDSSSKKELLLTLTIILNRNIGQLGIDKVKKELRVISYGLSKVDSQLRQEHQ